MSLYLAKWENNGIYLSRDEQMDYYLSKGASIYREDGSIETLIATPENGYLIERPTFPEKQSTAGPANSEYAIAGRILLGLEE